jgi:choline dehydrogenase-like flavoprotein
LIELLLSINAPGTIAVQAALQQPMSHGRLYINSSSIWDNPIVDPQYFSHPADIVTLRQGIKLARTIGSTPPFKDSLGAEVTPGPDVQTDADIENWLRNIAGTEFHPCGACAMLPKAQGGVVDANLKVYGLANVRVVDSSVFPVSFSAHLMAPTYALAEKAASIILAGPAPSGTGLGSSSGTSTAAPGSPSNSSGALGFGSMSWLWLPFSLFLGLFS